MDLSSSLHDPEETAACIMIIEQCVDRTAFCNVGIKFFVSRVVWDVNVAGYSTAGSADIYRKYSLISLESGVGCGLWCGCGYCPSNARSKPTTPPIQCFSQRLGLNVSLYLSNRMIIRTEYNSFVMFTLHITDTYRRRCVVRRCYHCTLHREMDRYFGTRWVLR